MNTTATTSAAADSPRSRRGNSAAAVVQASALPDSLGELVLAVTGKCRLWKSERTDVARELCGHFLDGLGAGATPASLSASFGDPRHAAKLITATRRRLRPLWWRTSRASMRVLGAFLLLCLVMYAVLAARFFLVPPRVNRNIMKELNVAVLQTAISERAWPLYIEAKKQFGPLPEFMMKSDHPDPRYPGEEGWDSMAQWLDANKPAMDTLRAAAAKPILGYQYRASTDPDLAKAIEVTSPGYKYDPTIEPNPPNPLVVGILLPHLGEMRQFARWLRADAHLAASRNDAAAFLADIDAMLGIATQALQDRFLISDLVGIAVAELTCSVVIREGPREDFLTSEQLRDLAHKLAAFADGRVTIDASTELNMVEDILQRFFSDDGNGDGHFVGGPEMDKLYDEWGLARPRGLPLLRAAQPIQSMFVSSRAEIMERARRFVAAAAADDALPPWRHNERTSDKAYSEMMNSGVYTAVPFLSSLQGDSANGPIERSCASRDLFETRRDAAMTAIAIESFRRARGEWPRALHELVPTFLPSLPRDPFDGKPLRYAAPRSAGERPLLYSVGVDAVDDGGAAPSTKAGRFAVHNFQWFGVDPATVQTYGVDQQNLAVSRGDWVLWPEPPPVVEPKLPDTNTENAQLK